MNRGSKSQKVKTQKVKTQKVKKQKRRTQKRYEPTVNKKLQELVSKTPLEINREILKCNAVFDKTGTISLTYGESTPSLSYVEPRIAVPKCYKISDKEAQETLLHNARSKKLLPASDIIAPFQSMANCWFNCGFMVNYISDRGRIFNRGFRESIIMGEMIGKNKRKTKVKPDKLRHALGYLAIAIDGCLRGDPLMHKLNTNHLILAIYKSIPKKNLPPIIRESKIDESSNPMLYYEGLYKYLYGNSEGAFPLIRLMLGNWKKGTEKKYQSFNFRMYLDMRVKMKFALRGIPFFREPEKAYKYLKKEELPALIVVEIENKHNKDNKLKSDDRIDASKTVRKPKEFRIGDVRYVLDAMVLRDVTNTHLCALLMYDGRQYGFDGESYSKINQFSWKNMINTNKRWTFRGSKWQGRGMPGKDGSPLYWNFRDGYQALYYYREN